MTYKNNTNMKRFFEFHVTIEASKNCIEPIVEQNIW